MKKRLDSEEIRDHYGQSIKVIRYGSETWLQDPARVDFALTTLEKIVKLDDQDPNSVPKELKNPDGRDLIAIAQVFGRAFKLAGLAETDPKHTRLSFDKDRVTIIKSAYYGLLRKYGLKYREYQ